MPPAWFEQATARSTRKWVLTDLQSSALPTELCRLDLMLGKFVISYIPYVQAEERADNESVSCLDVDMTDFRPELLTGKAHGHKSEQLIRVLLLLHTTFHTCSSARLPLSLTSASEWTEAPSAKAAYNRHGAHPTPQKLKHRLASRSSPSHRRFRCNGRRADIPAEQRQ